MSELPGSAGGTLITERRTVRAVGMVVCIALLLAAIDQGVKGLVTDALAPDKSRAVLPGLLDLTFRQNYGVAFSLLPLPMPALIALNAVVIGLFLFLIWPYLSTRTGKVSGMLVLGGAFGNIIDRIRLGYVVDYLNIHVWPVFNLADIAVVTGVGLLVLLILRAELVRHSAPGGASP